MARILIVTQSNETGLTYHRQTVPHKHFTRNYEGYDVDITYDISEATKEELGQYQIVSFLRLVDHEGKTEQILEKCKQAGCKTVIDIDDYWNLHPSHELSPAYKKHNIPQQTIDGLKNCDWVTTTTEHFADKIREFNKNVTVLPNSIDEAEMQFKPAPTYSNRLRFGWIGGVYHSQDIAMLQNGIKDVWRSCNHKAFQLCLGGYNKNRAYDYLETIFTDNYKYPKDLGYQKYLKTFLPLNNHVMDSEPYKRLWGKDVREYAGMYNDIDVALIPLVETAFNSYKSQIKIIEAGWFKKAAIVSNVMPYTIDCNRNNSILISPSKRGEGWGPAIKSLILDPNKAKDKAEALHELVKEKYSMDKTNIIRDQLYKRLCE